jgi:translation initiation factor 3 subunit G
VANKEEDEKEEEQSALEKIKAKAKGVVKCRICKEDHWTSNCPYKDTLGPLRESLAGKEPGEEGAPGEGPPAGGPGGPPGPAAGSSMGGVTGGKYVPPSRRDGAGGRIPGGGESMPDRRRSKCFRSVINNSISVYFCYKFQLCEE